MAAAERPGPTLRGKLRGPGAGRPFAHDRRGCGRWLHPVRERAATGHYLRLASGVSGDQWLHILAAHAGRDRQCVVAQPRQPDARAADGANGCHHRRPHHGADGVGRQHAACDPRIRRGRLAGRLCPIPDHGPPRRPVEVRVPGAGRGGIDGIVRVPRLPPGRNDAMDQPDGGAAAGDERISASSSDHQPGRYRAPAHGGRGAPRQRHPDFCPAHGAYRQCCGRFRQRAGRTDHRVRPNSRSRARDPAGQRRSDHGGISPG